MDTRAEDFTAAHRSLPFGTLVHVNNQDNGRTAVVRITDYYQPYGYQPYGYQPYGYYAPVPFPFFPFIR